MENNKKKENALWSNTGRLAHFSDVVIILWWGCVLILTTFAKKLLGWLYEAL